MVLDIPKASLTRDDMIDRAREIAPAIRERAAETERLRHIHPDTIADLRRTRLMRIVQPSRVGGLELDLLDGAIAHLVRALNSSGDKLIEQKEPKC